MIKKSVRGMVEDGSRYARPYDQVHCKLFTLVYTYGLVHRKEQKDLQVHSDIINDEPFDASWWNVESEYVIT